MDNQLKEVLAEELQNLWNELLTKEQLINIEPTYAPVLRAMLDKAYKAKAIRGFQIGNIGDCGYCIFLNPTNICMPITSWEDYCRAV